MTERKRANTGELLPGMRVGVVTKPGKQPKRRRRARQNPGPIRADSPLPRELPGIDGRATSAVVGPQIALAQGDLDGVGGGMGGDDTHPSSTGDSRSPDTPGGCAEFIETFDNDPIVMRKIRHVARIMSRLGTFEPGGAAVERKIANSSLDDEYWRALCGGVNPLERDA